MVSSRTYYLMALTRIPQLGGRRIKKLLRHFRDPEVIFQLSYKELAEITGTKIAEEITGFSRWDLVDEEIAFAERNGVEILDFLDEKYPLPLLHIPDFPPVLFKKGNLDLRRNRYISIVGTRKITPYGKEFVKDFIRSLAPYTPVIVSGMAYGVDIEAHKQALENHLPTVAVMGTSFRHIYPGVHREYAEQITKQGALLSEFWSYEQTDKNFFVRRNRIIAGLSAATVVVESGLKGGAILTAQMAFDYNREVFAVPGRVTDTYSQGCNRLIRENVAQILTTPGDLIAALKWEAEEIPPAPVQKKLFVELSPPEQKIVDFLTEVQSEHLDIIALETGMSVSKVSQLLMMMELNGVVQSLPGKKFKIA